MSCADSSRHSVLPLGGRAGHDPQSVRRERPASIREERWELARDIFSSYASSSGSEGAAIDPGTPIYFVSSGAKIGRRESDPTPTISAPFAPTRRSSTFDIVIFGLDVTHARHLSCRLHDLRSPLHLAMDACADLGPGRIFL